MYLQLYIVKVNTTMTVIDIQLGIYFKNGVGKGNEKVSDFYCSYV